MEKRYVEIKALQIGKELIPYWKLDYIPETDTDNDMYSFEGVYYHEDLVNSIWDVQEKEFKVATTLYLTPRIIKYKHNQKVAVKVDYGVYGVFNQLRQEKIDKIDWEDDEFVHYYQGNKFIDDGSYELKYILSIPIEDLEEDTFYQMKYKKPIYILSDGQKIKNDYDLFDLI